MIPIAGREPHVELRSVFHRRCVYIVEHHHEAECSLAPRCPKTVRDWECSETVNGSWVVSFAGSHGELGRSFPSCHAQHVNAQKIMSPGGIWGSKYQPLGRFLTCRLSCPDYLPSHCSEVPWTWPQLYVTWWPGRCLHSSRSQYPRANSLRKLWNQVGNYYVWQRQGVRRGFTHVDFGHVTKCYTYKSSDFWHQIFVICNTEINPIWPKCRWTIISDWSPKTSSEDSRHKSAVDSYLEEKQRKAARNEAKLEARAVHLLRSWAFLSSYQQRFGWRCTGILTVCYMGNHRCLIGK